MRLRDIATAALVSLVGSPSLGWAGNTATELVAARELWEQAQAAQARQDWAACERALTAALPIVATPGMRFHLAHCREMQGKWVEALVDYKLVDEVLGSGEPAPDVEPLLKPAIARLEAKTPKLLVGLKTVPRDLQFILDGEPLSQGLINTRLSLNPGSHVLQLTAAGYVPLTRRVTLVEAEQRDLSLTLVPRDETTRIGLGETRASDEGDSLQPYLLIAEAALTLGAGSVALYHGLEADVAQTSDARDSANTKALVWGVGSGLGLTSFFATWLLWPEHEVVVQTGSSGARILWRGSY